MRVWVGQGLLCLCLWGRFCFAGFELYLQEGVCRHKGMRCRFFFVLSRPLRSSRSSSKKYVQRREEGTQRHYSTVLKAYDAWNS